MAVTNMMLTSVDLLFIQQNLHQCHSPKSTSNFTKYRSCMQERVTLTGPEPEEINDLIKDTSDTVQDFPKNSVQYLLWEEQGSILQD